LLLSPEFFGDIRGGRGLPKLAERLDKSRTVDAERYEFPSMSREYTELAGRGCLSICVTAGTAEPTATIAVVGVAGVCAGSASSSFTLASPSPALGQCALPSSTSLSIKSSKLRLRIFELKTKGSRPRGPVVLCEAGLHRNGSVVGSCCFGGFVGLVDGLRFAFVWRYSDTTKSFEGRSPPSSSLYHFRSAASTVVMLQVLSE
jgi:hypothetical protein